MTLSGKSTWKERREAAREWRQAKQEDTAAKRPWQLPLIVGLAVVFVVVAVLAYTVFGVGR